MKSLHIINVHGIGHKTPADFADKAMKRLSAALTPRGIGVYARSVHWGPLLDGPEERAYKELQRRGMEGRLLQGAMWRTFADALMFKNYTYAIQQLFDYEVTKLRAPEHVVFVAHSLGCTLLSDYLNSRPSVKARALTMGNNQGLWYMGREHQYVTPPQLQGGSRWVNLFEEDDGIGAPVGHWIPAARDVEVSVGGILTGFWGASHGKYWTDRRLFSRTVPELMAQWAV